MKKTFLILTVAFLAFACTKVNDASDSANASDSTKVDSVSVAVDSVQVVK